MLKHDRPASDSPPPPHVDLRTSENSRPGQRLTSTLLGYPADARLLIVNADDFGMCHSINEATLRAFKRGIVSSTTLMAPCPWARHAIRILKENPDIPFGVHLTAVSEYADYRWGPLVGKDAAPTLVDDNGFFYRVPRIPELLAGASVEELESEFRAQIETVLAASLSPTHLDWHCLADGGRPDIFDITLGLAREYGLALRIHDRRLAETRHGATLPANDHELLDSFSLGSINKSARYITLLRELPAGLTEWAVHPSLGNAESRAMQPDNWQVRKADFEFLMSPEARDVLNEEGIVLMDYQALQVLWTT